MKYSLLLLVLIMGLNFGCSQHKSPPRYLINQKFPDSVGQFKIQNVKNEMISFEQVLASHKGKKIVLDFWASWCKDCLEGLPELQRLQQKTEDVAYVFLSLDKTEKRWRNAIKSLGVKGHHYFIAEGWENPLTNYVGLDWIPRYMILDEKGNVLHAKATKATDKKLRKILLK